MTAVEKENSGDCEPARAVERVDMRKRGIAVAHCARLPVTYTSRPSKKVLEMIAVVMPTAATTTYR